MFGPKISTVFRSRWNALFWAAGIMLTAYCSVPSPDEGKEDKAANEAAEKAIKQIKGIDFGALDDGNRD
jgi:hypothetical protein